MDEMSKEGQVSVKEQHRSENKGFNVDTVFSVETERENFTVNLYHTTNTIVVNGKGFYKCYQSVLPKLYELCYENEKKISQLNEKIFEGLSGTSFLKTENSKFSDETIVIENKDMDTDKKMIENQENIQNKPIAIEKEVTVTSDAVKNDDTETTIIEDQKQSEVDNDIDFQTNNNQEKMDNDEENQAKGTKRVRVDSDEERDDVVPAERAERKERKVEGIESVNVDKQYVFSDEEQQIMMIDHSYSSEKKEMDEVTEEAINDIKSTNDVKVNHTNLKKGDKKEIKECPKCKKNCVTNAVICEDCNTWMHYYCIGTTQEKVEADYPGDFVCKPCMERKASSMKETDDSRKARFEKNSNLEQIDKPNTQIVITQVPSEVDKSEQITILEKENKKLKSDMNNLKETIQDLELKIKHKDKQLMDRKNEAVKLHKTIEGSKMELTTMGNRYEVLKHERDTLSNTISLNKESWNEDLSSQLQQQYILTKNIEVEAKNKEEKLQAQYTSMMGEMEERIAKKDEEIMRSKTEITRHKEWLQQAENSMKKVKEQEEKIINLEKVCQVLAKDKDQIGAVNQKLEEQVHKMKNSTNPKHDKDSFLNKNEGIDNNVLHHKAKKGPVVTSMISKFDQDSAVSNSRTPSNHEQPEAKSITSDEVEETINSIRREYKTGSSQITEMEYEECSSECREKRKLGCDINELEETDSYTKRFKEADTDNGKYPVKSILQNTRKPAKQASNIKSVKITDRREESNQEHEKKCYGCGSRSHEVRDCERRCNIYARFKGDSWINKTAVEWAFEGYGIIKMIRIQRNRYGEETRSAMICFEREDAATDAIEGMRNSIDWDVNWYRPKQRTHLREQMLDRRNEKYNTSTSHQHKHSDRSNNHNHWTSSKSNFFNKKEYDDDFPLLGRGEQELKGEVQILKDQMLVMSKNIYEMLRYIRN